MTNSEIIEQIRSQAEKSIRDLTGRDVSVNVRMQGSIDRVLDVVCEVYGIMRIQLTGRFRYRYLVDARRIAAMQLLFQGLTVVEVGNFLYKDHSTINHLRNTCSDLYYHDNEFHDYYKLVEERLSYDTIYTQQTG